MICLPLAAYLRKLRQATGFQPRIGLDAIIADVLADRRRQRRNTANLKSTGRPGRRGD